MKGYDGVDCYPMFPQSLLSSYLHFQTIFILPEQAKKTCDLYSSASTTRTDFR